MAQKAQLYLKEWRLHRQMTQEQLAERIGSSKGHVSLLERGLKGYSDTMLAALSAALVCQPWELLAIDPSNPQNEILKIWNHIPDERRALAAQTLKAFTN